MKRFLICTISPKGKIRVYKQLNGEEEVAKLAAQISSAFEFQKEIDPLKSELKKAETHDDCKIIVDQLNEIFKKIPYYYQLLELKDCMVIPYSSILNFL